MGLKSTFQCFILLMIFIPGMAQSQDNKILKSPDGQIQVDVLLQNGQPFYRVTHGKKPVLENSPLGFITNLVNLSADLSWVGTKQNTINKRYHQDKIKRADIHYVANELVCSFINKDKKLLNVVFRVSNDNIAFRYEIPEAGVPLALVVEKETTGFNFPKEAKGFLTPQSKSMVGFARTKPSYEEGYKIDQEISTRKAYGLGYTFSGLFKVDDYWALISETGVSGF